jgi:hypothetical protein
MSIEKSTEIEVKENTKVSDQLIEQFGLDSSPNFDFKNEETIELLKKCGKREQKAVITVFNKTIQNYIEQLMILRTTFTEIDLTEKFEIDQSKLMKSFKKNKKATKTESDDINSEENDGEGGVKTVSAVNKPEKCHDFVKTFMVTQEFDEAEEYSPNQIRSAMNKFVNDQRKENPDKINVKPANSGDDINKKIFKIYGPLKEIIENCINNIKEDVSTVEKSIKEKKKEKPAEDSASGKEIINMQMWVDKYKELANTPESLQFTDFMKYSPFCKIDRNPLEKAKKKPPAPKKKA